MGNFENTVNHMKGNSIILGLSLIFSVSGCYPKQEKSVTMREYENMDAKEKDENKEQIYTGTVAGIDRYADGSCTVLVINKVSEKYSGQVEVERIICEKIRPEDYVLVREFYMDGEQVSGKIEKIK